MKVELDFDLGKDELRTLWCMMARARKGQKQALLGLDEEDETLPDRADHDSLFVYYSAALGAYVDVLALAAPKDLQPDGSETQKP